MPVKPCRDCGADVGLSATHCPKCGSRFPAKSSDSIVLVVFVILALIVGIALTRAL